MTAPSTTGGLWTRAYRGWMAFADGMRRTVAAVIFGSVYLTVGLVFAIARRVFTRRARAGSTFWRQRAERAPTADFFRRMS